MTLIGGKDKITRRSIILLRRSASHSLRRYPESSLQRSPIVSPPQGIALKVDIGAKGSCYKNIDLEAFKKNHGLEKFEVRFYGEGDDPTLEMIQGYNYSHDRLLTTAFPPKERLRGDHDHKWHRTPLNIIGPWTYGWAPKDETLGRTDPPERYEKICLIYCKPPKKLRITSRESSTVEGEDTEAQEVNNPIIIDDEEGRDSDDEENDEERIETTPDPISEMEEERDLGGRDKPAEVFTNVDAKRSTSQPAGEDVSHPMNVDSGSQPLNLSIEDFQVSGVEFSFGKKFLAGESGSQSERTVVMGVPHDFRAINGYPFTRSRLIRVRFRGYGFGSYDTRKDPDPLAALHDFNFLSPTDDWKLEAKDDEEKRDADEEDNSEGEDVDVLVASRCSEKEEGGYDRN
ncbi:hypothetical protein C5167_039720 [Papaver somniferum]|uniref:Uncharacterized protein n=1 Tax=Papaver somniferum TaxID=3469 RepID=A0A4Y7IGE9_PAPSO|nr:hypothetical protein C5167_039720 [Papaver somniferum]